MSNTDPTLMNMWRRLITEITVNDIIGVAPMKGPTGSIFEMRKRYGESDPRRVPMTKAHYRTFLRINDRPRTQTLLAFRDAGYPTVEFKGHTTTAEDWCSEQFGLYGFRRIDTWFGTHFAFKDEIDATAFRMRWL